MKIFIFTVFVIAFTLSGMNLQAQSNKCGTMKNLEEMIKKDPSLKAKMIVHEAEIEQWINNNPQSRVSNLDNFNNHDDASTKNGKGTSSLCGYNNTLSATISAPTVLNQVVSPTPNCTYGGEFVRVTGMRAGKIYRISTCGVNNFDTQLSVYLVGGSQAVAHNDDWCGSQSQIYFNPLANAAYDILIDQYDCASNSLCASLEIELVYTPRPVITIPVAVHVIHFGEPIGNVRNLSVAQIQSQIDVLNEDFRRLNSDISITPAAFRGSSDDPLVEFCLAAQDDHGNPTTGIDRWKGSQPSWDMDAIETIIKPLTIWDRNRYLNLWTLEFGGSEIGTLGYAQFPGTGAANTDGVVIGYNNFGTMGSVTPPFNLGRTATHEVGHWLNLKHIWGDESGCTTDDEVSDTPLQDEANYGLQSFPLLDACSQNYPGVMFYNYMDYSDDITLTMFTFGQAARIDATLFGDRVSLLSSLGCLSSVGTNEISSDRGIEIYPNPNNGYFTINVSNLKSENTTLYVYNMFGSRIETFENISSFPCKMDLTTLANGIYYIRYTSENNTITKKIIISK